MQLALTLFACSQGATVLSESQANPIRRVVGLMQNMVKKIEAEAERDDELFAKFACYCDKNSAAMAKAIADGKTQIGQLQSDIASDKAARDQVVSELAQHKEERAAANEAVDAATKQRSQENKAFEDESADLNSNLGALSQAIPAIENGLSGFLQTPGAQTVLSVAQKTEMEEDDRASIVAFFQGKADAPGSGEIVGILKTMKEEMEKRLAEISDTEKEAVANFNGLISAKNKEISAAQAAIEEKTERQGDLAVKITTEKNDLRETSSTLDENEEYSAELSKSCDTKTKEYDAIKKSRAEELLALADTIKLLNSDDALELFKKSLPSPALLQVTSSMRELKAQALVSIRAAARRYGNPQMDLLALALQGKKGGMGKVMKQVDSMEGSLDTEQVDDDAKLKYCKAEIEATDDKASALATKLADEDAHLAFDEETIDSLKQSIKDLVAGIKALDKAVAEATEQRKAEHEEYIESTAENNAAMELLEFAKNRLNKFYNPKEYVAPPQAELTDEEKAEQAYSFVQLRDAPPAFGAGAGDKSSSGDGVIGMINQIKNDLKMEMNQAKLEENDAQADYERLQSDSTAKRAADMAAKTEKEAALADAQADYTDSKEGRAATQTDVDENKQYSMNLHVECDFLVENFETRKTARKEEHDALEKSKAVLAGANLSLLQIATPKASLLTKGREQSCSVADEAHRRMVQSKLALLQGFCEDMCRIVGSHPDCAVCNGFVPPPAAGVLDWDGLYAQFDKLKLVGRDQIKEWTGDAGKFGR
jgi:DNA repair exonuclease SbcCD ATPase subunit